MNGQRTVERKAEQLVFHPQSPEEYNLPSGYGEIANQFGVRPKYRDYSCGACCANTTGRVLCDVKRKSDGATILWCVCACDKQEPSVFIQKEGQATVQHPSPKKFHASPAWPPELATLYEEAAKSFAAGAFTSSSMVCRKILMSCVCHEQEKAGEPVLEGQTFKYYVDYLAEKILTLPSAKAPMDVIRKIGNEANHHIELVSQTDAERSLSIVHLMLDTIYSLAAA